MSEKPRSAEQNDGAEDERSVSISGSGQVTGGSFDRVRITGSGKVTCDDAKRIEITGSGRIDRASGAQHTARSDDTKGARSASINGSGIIMGGVYSTVNILGSGKITSDVTCTALTICGSGKAMGTVEGETVTVSGSGAIDGDLRAGTLETSGSASFGSNVVCTSMEVSGSTDVKGSLNAQNMKVLGSVKVGGDCNAEQFNLEGSFAVGGLLNADDINICLRSNRSRAQEIGGERIAVRSKPFWFGLLPSIFGLRRYHARLEAELIEGNEISLENTTAKVVRGNNIVLGKGCEIELAEYKGSLRLLDDATCAEERKLL